MNERQGIVVSSSRNRRRTNSIVVPEYLSSLSLDAIKPFPNNPRRHSKRQLRQLAASIDEFSFTNPVLVDEDGELIAGHGRVEAARLCGLSEIPAYRIAGLTEAQKRALRIADNRIAETSTWDADLLAGEMQFLIDSDFDIESIGFDAIDLDKLLTPKGGAGDIEEPPPLDPPADPVARRGDLWALGDHKLACGDARDAVLLSLLLAGELCAMVFSDPPYNVPIPGHVTGKGCHHHANFQMASGEMTRAQFRSFLLQVLTAALAVCRDGALLYLCIDWRGLELLLEVGRSLDLQLMNICVWAKSNAGMGSFYRSQHEFVVVLKYGSAAHVNNVQLGRLGRNRSNVWQYPGGSSFSKTRQRDLADHPTVKPLALVADAIQDASRPNDLVLDLFGGSGTTLLAAHMIKRRAALVEIEPAYVDVTLRRFQAMTGIEPVLLPDRVPLSKVKAQRQAGSTAP